MITAAREELVQGLERIGGITVFPGTANFLLCHLRQRRVKAAAFAAALAAEGILIRNASNFAGLDPYYIRLAVRHPAANARLLEKFLFVSRNFLC
jgi:threonine-phosphate decarboxylase